ncbi:hypothetical protein NSPZN2_11030 [Nitrospira defluvii]|uniref:Uncharacterized protein n=1 Tax=Nitrospira defluvii TaxID=330214 RepID=A0ABM8QNN9_9BACT|nr:hypothetical protein NSPZN2_11030 [Nitrospira defluvii]
MTNPTFYACGIRSSISCHLRPWPPQSAARHSIMGHLDELMLQYKFPSITHVLKEIEEETSSDAYV